MTNPIFTRNPIPTLALARALGAVQDPTAPPEERARAFAAVLNPRPRVASAWLGHTPALHIGYRAGPVFVCARFLAHGQEDNPTTARYTLAVYSDCTILTTARRPGRRADRRFRAARAVYRTVTGWNPSGPKPALTDDGQRSLILPDIFHPVYGDLHLIPTHHPVFRALAERAGGLREVVRALRRVAEDPNAVLPAIRRAMQGKGR